MSDINDFSRREFVTNACKTSLVLSTAGLLSRRAHAARPELGAPTETRDADVLVAGGGFAGSLAAIGAAGDGARVVLVEPHNVLGGQGTAGGVAGFCGDTKRVNQPFAELIASLSARDLIHPYNPNADRRAYDLEGCAFFLQKLVLAKGAEPFLHAQVADARAGEDGFVEEVLVVTDGKRILYRPKFVIDATGDCFLAAYGGFPTMHEGVNEQLPMSLYFTLWDSGEKVTPFLPENCPAWETDEDLPMTTVHNFPSGKAEVKMKVIGFDSADGDSLSKAEIHARRQMMGLVYHLQTKGYRGKVYGRHVLASASRQIGIRGSRRIIGEHVLTEKEVNNAALFDDAVAIGTYHIDYHWPDRVQRAGTGITTALDPYPIPLRSLIPKGAKNLLAAGRCASADQMAMSSMRVMATCAQMGYAAGTAARQCLLENCNLSAAPIRKIQTALENNGQSLDISEYGEYLAKTRNK